MGKCKDEMIKLINGEVEKVYIISEFETHYDISKSLQVWKYDKEKDILSYTSEINSFICFVFPSFLSIITNKALNKKPVNMVNGVRTTFILVTGKNIAEITDNNNKILK